MTPVGGSPAADRFGRRDTAVLALAGYALHFMWEMAQAPLFVTMKELPFWTGTAWCARAAGWDVVINAAAYLCAALVAGDALWVGRRTATGFAAYFAFGLIVTILIERWAVGSGHWRYDEAMPAIAGVAVTPLAQWIVVPAVMAWLARWRSNALRKR